MDISETNKTKKHENSELQSNNHYESDIESTNKHYPDSQIIKSNTHQRFERNYENYEDGESCKEKDISKCYSINNGLNQSLNNSKNNNTYFSNKKKFKISNALAFFINLKKFFFIFILLFGYVTNFSAFNLVYFIIAISFAFNYSDNDCYDISKKKYLVYINLFFCICFLIFKTIIFIFFSEADSISEAKRTLLITLGCIFVYEKTFACIMFTFALDTIVFVYSFIYIFTCSNFNENLDSKEIKKNKIKLSESKVSFLYLILHFFYYCILIINFSFSTIFYSVFIHIGLLLKVFNRSDKFNSFAFRLFNILNILRVFTSEIFNIYVLKVFIKENHLETIFSLIGIFINPPQLSIKPLDPSMNPDEEKKYEEDLLNFTKFVFDFFMTVLAIALYSLISSIRVVRTDDKKRSLLKKQLVKDHHGHSVYNNEASSVSFTNKKLNLNSLSFTPYEKSHQDFNKIKIKSLSKSSDEEILHTIHEDEGAKSHYNEEPESLPIKKQLVKNLITEQPNSNEEEEFNINKISKKYKSLPQNDGKEGKGFNSSKSNNKDELEKAEDHSNKNTDDRQFKQFEEKGDQVEKEENVSKIDKTNENQNENTKKLINEEDPLTKQIAYDQPDETEDYQIIENKDLISVGEEEDEERNIEDIDENMLSDYTSDLSYESENEEKDKKINTCWQFVERFLHGVYKFYKKIKSFLYAYLNSAYFRLDICRICVIIWIYNYNNYQTIPLILWFFFSIQAESLSKINVVTFLFAWPSLLINYYCFIVSNIDDLIQFSNKPEEDVFLNIYGLEKFQYASLHFMFVHFTIIAFTFLSINLNQSKKKEEQLGFDHTNNTFNNTYRFNKTYQDESGEVKNQNESGNYADIKKDTCKIVEYKNIKSKKDKNKNVLENDKIFIEMEDKSDENVNSAKLQKFDKPNEKGKDKIQNKLDIYKSIEGLDKSNFKETLLNKDENAKDYLDLDKSKCNDLFEFESNPKKAYLEGKTLYESGNNQHPIKIKVEDSIDKKKSKNSEGYMNLQEAETLEQKENSDNEHSSSVNSKDNMVRFSDIIIKFFLKHIDKITLIFIYMIAIERVNIVHFRII